MSTAKQSRARKKPFKQESDAYKSQIALTMAYVEAEKMMKECKDESGALNEEKIKNNFLNLIYSHHVAIDVMGISKVEKYNKVIDRYSEIFQNAMKKQEEKSNGAD